jgi:ABC-type multidrug transport system fused ATPase/permease subunit
MLRAAAASVAASLSLTAPAAAQTARPLDLETSRRGRKGDGAARSVQKIRHDKTTGEHMKSAFLIAAVLIGIAVLIALKNTSARKIGAFGARAIATSNEQKMFWRLVSAFPTPEFVVLTQVSFGALLTAKGGASRYSFAQKRADFVVASKGFKVLAVVELDDSSHKKRETEDASRDAMLVEAGYKVVRYKHIPTVALLLADIAPEPPAPVIA